MPVVPRVGEFLKFRNPVVGDYFAFRVSEVTYREGGLIEVWTELLDNVNTRMYSFEEEAEFDEYFNSYVAEGWLCPRGVGPNRRLGISVPNSEDGVQSDERESEYAGWFASLRNVTSRPGYPKTLAGGSSISGGRTHPVCQRDPNAWGFFDMIGNVWEWCADVWHSGYDSAPDDGSPWLDDAARQPRRCLRGVRGIRTHSGVVRHIAALTIGNWQRIVLDSALPSTLNIYRIHWSRDCGIEEVQEGW